MCQHSSMPLRCDGTGPTELLIVGVAHLDLEVSDSALNRGVSLLRNWHPDLVAIECLPGHLVVEYQDRGGIFNEFPVGFAAQARQGAAAVAAVRSWNVWQAREVGRDQDATVTERVTGWLLAREPCNALLLPWQHADLPAAAQEFLTDLANSPSERVRVGVRLGSELGHTELIHFDDHAGTEILDELPDLMNAVEGFYQTFRGREPQPPAAPSADQDAWLQWTWASTPATRNWLEAIESVGMAEQGDGLLRARLAQWRSRNLAMASRLRASTALIPGGRLLAIVGHSHEGPLRAALSRLFTIQGVVGV